MAERRLAGCRILVVEDEYLLADELRSELADAGAVVLGPVGTLGDAVDLILSGQPIDGAVLDVNLHGEMAFPAADLLVERGLPLVFTTGYEESVIPARFAAIPRCEKPVKAARVAQAIGQAMQP